MNPIEQMLLEDDETIIHIGSESLLYDPDLEGPEDRSWMDNTYFSDAKVVGD